MKFSSIAIHIANKKTRVRYHEDISFDSPMDRAEVEYFAQRWWRTTSIPKKEDLEYLGWWPNLDAKRYLVKKFREKQNSN